MAPRASTRTLLPGGTGLDGLVRRTVLPGGLRVITEAVPGVRSAAFGLWVDVGSRDETPALAGASHYLEHLLFKGTSRRNALEIAASLEEVGGEANAFTAKEQTCFYARVLDADLPLEHRVDHRHVARRPDAEACAPGRGEVAGGPGRRLDGHHGPLADPPERERHQVRHAVR